MWKRIWDRIRVAAGKGEAVVDAEVQRRVPRAQWIRARYLLMLISLVVVAGYCWHRWNHSVPKPAGSPAPVGDTGTYQAPQIPSIEKGLRKGNMKPRSTVRSIVTIPTEILPEEEQAKIPPAATVVGTDNVPRSAELANTALAPASRGATEVRNYVMPDGSLKSTLEFKREAFWGFDWKRLEVEGRYGIIGNTTARGTARWIPLRTGNVHFGVEGSVSTERDGVVRGEGLAVFRYEPFRDSYK